MTRKEFFTRLKDAREKVNREIAGNSSSGGLYARGLASEGYAGGYRDALSDCEAMLRHGCPHDNRGYWTKP